MGNDEEPRMFSMIKIASIILLSLIMMLTAVGNMARAGVQVIQTPL